MSLDLFILPLSLFILSMLGISINRSNIIMILLCLEMMLLSIILSFLFGSFFLNNDLGQLNSIFIMTMAAVESAIGLSIMIVFSKIKGSVSIRFLNVLKG
uniref:NADH-ubiquinone oxidoreductase chain 4L n=1 Tax=Blackfordia virginica TaxID=47071 RepID=A0A7U0KKR3_9CNID|nr:NADH dehydrogenase subunit 4L [Blackfordia virginica]QQW46712.1 NADH dehydrogenase subunit 4L [Blackfordia virginica]